MSELVSDWKKEIEHKDWIKKRTFMMTSSIIEKYYQQRGSKGEREEYFLLKYWETETSNKRAFRKMRAKRLTKKQWLRQKGIYCHSHSLSSLPPFSHLNIIVILLHSRLPSNLPNSNFSPALSFNITFSQISILLIKALLIVRSMKKKIHFCPNSSISRIIRRRKISADWQQSYYYYFRKKMRNIFLC